MKKINSKIEEQLRLKTLEKYKILDTLPEQMYDDIIQIASFVCEMPIALLSLVDENRQFFKSKVGISINQTPIEQSVCYHAIQSGEELFQVLDLRTDDRFKDNPLVTHDPNIVSYFGVPLESKEGVAFGTLCVISQHHPKSISDEQKSILKKLAKQVSYLLELRLTNNDLIISKELTQSYLAQMEEFAYTAAHDLRAPLRAVKSFLQLIESKNKDVHDEKDIKYFKFVFDNVKSMDDLIVDLLEFAKSDDKIGEKEDIDLNEFITDIYNHVNVNPEENQLQLNKLPTIHFSKLALGVIFNNLIENALKYKKPNQMVNLQVHYVEDDFQHIFEIIDDGIGISEEHFELIFKPFKRLHTKSEFSGSGLGLATVKKIIEKIEGSISVHSVLNEGTTFKIVIPKQ
ncbi:sensor histidine kinase/GAF domain hybrid protein [Flavobacteria bacterium BAL38]|nr:sensor histidine kinase/GAF domain hybrid protein [Flavobacteria bacterium BAL38]